MIKSVAHHVPFIDDERWVELGPDIDGTARQRLPFPGFQRLAIGAMRDQVVLPGIIIEALANEPAVGFIIRRLIVLRFTGSDRKRLRLAGPEITLENKHVR